MIKCDLYSWRHIPPIGGGLGRSDLDPLGRFGAGNVLDPRGFRQPRGGGIMPGLPWVNISKNWGVCKEDEIYVNIFDFVEVESLPEQDLTLSDPQIRLDRMEEPVGCLLCQIQTWNGLHLPIMMICLCKICTFSFCGGVYLNNLWIQILYSCDSLLLCRFLCNSLFTILYCPKYLAFLK